MSGHDNPGDEVPSDRTHKEVLCLDSDKCEFWCPKMDAVQNSVMLKQQSYLCVCAHAQL